MKYLTLFFILLSLSFCSIDNSQTNESTQISKTDSSDFHWKTYRDTVETGIDDPTAKYCIVSFKYPDSLIVEKYYNNLYIGRKIRNTNGTSDSSKTSSKDWSISMIDLSDPTITDYSLDDQIQKLQDSITINNSIAFRETFRSSNKTLPYRQCIQLIKYSTIFNITNDLEITKETFEKFYNSLTIDAYDKPSH